MECRYRLVQVQARHSSSVADRFRSSERTLRSIQPCEAGLARTGRFLRGCEPHTGGPVYHADRAPDVPIEGLECNYGVAGNPGSRGHETLDWNEALPLFAGRPVSSSFGV